VGYFERKFQMERGVAHQRLLLTRVNGLSRGVVCVILHLAVLTQSRRATDRQTNGRTDRHTMTVNTRAIIASRG